MFSAQTYEQRRSALMAKVGSGLILLPANEESSMNYADNTYPYRQDSHFLYFSGLNQPGLALVLDADSGISTLYGDDLSIDYIVWMGPQPTIAALAASAGIERTAPYSELAQLLKTAAAKGQAVHFMPPYRADRSIQLCDWLNIPLHEVATRVSEPLVKAIVDQRIRKSDEEVAEIEKGVNISGAMHVAAMRAAREGIKESALVGIVQGIAASDGGLLPYGIILTVNGQTLHNHYHGNTLKSGQLVLCDFGGASSMQYAGDITRTFPVDKTFTTQQKEIYQIVLDAQMAAIAACNPGTRYYDVHHLAAKIMAEGLKSLGLMKGDMEEAVAVGAHALFFPHGLGHMLGLDVHDLEDAGENYVGYAGELERSTLFGTRSLRLGRALQPGFVLTVEPGIYFIPELTDLWKKEGRFSQYINYDVLDAYRHFGGIRIEDNVLVTESGHKVLGNPIPKTITEVEVERQKSFPLLV